MDNATRIVPVGTARELKAFVDLPYALYARNPAWVPPLRRDELHRLSPRRNAFLRHARMQLWIALAGHHVIGRVAAIEDRLFNEKHGERVMWFGFLEAERPDTIRGLLEAVEQRAAADRIRVVRGPANPSLNESAGLLVDNFHEPPYVLMPYNPPFYPDAVESAGYVKVKDLLAWDIDMAHPLPERVARIAARAAERHGVAIRRVNMKAFDDDLATLQRIYRAAWEDNWGFVAPTGEEVAQLARELRPVVDPEIALFAEIGGEAVGCAIAIPDVNQVLARMRGRLLPFGIVHFLRRKAIICRARVILLGVLPPLRRIGLYPLLMAELYRRGARRGYRRGELSWTLEDNDAVNAGIEAVGGRRYKTYRLYEKRS